jgi:DNA-binding MarR family transcriptional regulator
VYACRVTQRNFFRIRMTKAAPRRKRIHIYGDDYVPYYLNHLNNRLSSGASQLYRKHFGVGLNEFRILSVMANAPGCTANHICQTLGLHKAVVSRSLQEMQAKGLVDIDASNKQRLLTLTEAGDAMHDEIVVIALERQKRLLAGIPLAEREKMFALMRHMLENIPAVNAWDPFQPEPAPAARKRAAVKPGARESGP